MQMEGKKLGGRYEVINRIGGGGMAIVYKAVDRLLNRHVAIKVLSDSLSNDSEFIRRFSREAQAAASLSHQNIVNVYDVGREGYTHYIVMELVEGPTLKEHILEHAPLSMEDTGEIASQICDGLYHAHENQIVHRDIKPHNILIGHNGRVKVTDFGIARAATSSTITQTGSVMGSVHYFSPEQARGGLVSEKSDIYSLGVVLFEMLTGELPFDGDSAISIALKHLQDPVPNPLEYNSEISENMVRIVMRALEKDANMRYTSAKAMMQDVRYATSMSMESSWSQGKQKQGFFQTIPLSLDDDTDIASPQISTSVTPQVHKNKVETEPKQSNQPQHVANQQNQPNKTAQKSRSQVGDKTLFNLERLRNVPSDQDKTILERTVIYLDDLQSRMPWWQKMLFGILTLVIIGSLTIWGLTTLWGLFPSGAESPDTVNDTTQSQGMVMKNFKNVKEEEAKKWLVDKGINESQIEVYRKKVEGFNAGEVVDQEPKANTAITADTKVTLTVALEAGQFKVDDFTGLWQTDAQAKAAKYNGQYNVDVNNSRCWKSDTVQHGKILTQSPKPGSLIEQGGTVKLWISVNHDHCQTPPPAT